MVMRIIMPFSLSWVIGLTAPLFSVFRQKISGSVLVEFPNMCLRRKSEPVKLHNPYTNDDPNKPVSQLTIR
jgi:hypothetical protein